MQMHRMSHVGRVREGHSDALAAVDIKRVAIRISCAVDCPNVRCHVATKRCRERAINGAIGKRIESPQLLFLGIVERRSRYRSCPRELRHRCAFCSQNDSAHQFRPFPLCENRKRAALFWDCYLQVEALRHPELEKIALSWLHSLAINCQELGFQTAGVDKKILIGGRGYDPE